MLQADGRPVMAVLPTSHRLNLHELKTELDAKHIEMLPEGKLTKLCPDCELGAFPPFGGLYGMQTLVDRSLAQSEEIVFNAGRHTDALRMKYADYANLMKPPDNFGELPLS
jgi:Ala-tRNA(Pro) deacylase